MTYAVDQTLAYLASLPLEAGSVPKVDSEIDTLCANYQGGAEPAKRALLDAITKCRDFPMKGYVLDRLAGLTE